MRELDGVRLATFRSRLAAMAIDGAIVWLAVYVLDALISQLFPGWLPRHPWLPESPRDLIPFLDSPSASVSGIVFLLYFIVGLRRGRGQTFGKRLLGIRVVSEQAREMAIGDCIQRTVAYFGLPPFFMWPVQYKTDPNAQTTPDRVGGTVVIQDGPPAR